MATAITQLQTANELGRKAFLNGTRNAPCLDRDLMTMLNGRAVGETPEGQADTNDLMRNWSKGWNRAQARSNWKTFEKLADAISEIQKDRMLSLYESGDQFVVAYPSDWAYGNK